MKPFLLPIIILLNLAQACTPIEKGPNTKVDLKGGYKNLKLDATYDSLKQLIELHQTLDNQCTKTKKFEITTEPYTSISTIRFDKVALEFVRDSLYRVTLSRRYDYETDGQLHKIFRAEFGEPSEERKTLAGIKYVTYKWIGARTYIHVIQRDHSDFDIEYGSFRGMRRSIDEEQNCDQQNLKKGSSK